jgi:PAS domain S-box-containing protein
MSPDSFQQDSVLKKIQGRYSPASVLLMTILGIALAEVIAMIVVYFYRDLPYPQQILLDAVVMTVIIFPILYLLSFRPLLKHIDERWRAEKQLQEMALFPTLNPDAVLQVDATGRITKCNPIAEQMGLSVDTVLFDLVPDLRDLNLAECIAFGTTLQAYETRMGERFLQWRVRGAPELGFAFLYSQDITERKRGEEAIKLLSRIVEQSADTVVVTNHEGIIEYVNLAVESVTGYAMDELLGKTPRLFKSGVHDRQFYKELWGTILSGEIFHGDITNRTKNGELIHETKTITPLRDAQGNITHFVATGKDITARKKAEENLRKAYDEVELRVQERTEELSLANAELQTARLAALDLMEDAVCSQKELEKVNILLRESEERLNRAQEIAHLGSWELNLETNRLTWSDEVYRIFGLKPQQFEATYEAFLEAVHPNDRRAVDEAYSSSLRDGRDSYEIEHRVVRHANAEIRIVHEKCEHIRDASGKIIRSIGMVHDITERKQAQEQLQYQATLLSNVNDAIVASDAQFHITAWNAAAELLYGWKSEEVLGCLGVDIIRTEWAEQDAIEMRRIIAETGRWRGEASQARKDGTRFPVEVSSIVLYDERGQVAGYVSVNRDITERKRAEEARRKSEEQFFKIFHHSPVGVNLFRLEDGCSVDINDAFLELTGYSREEFIGHTGVELNLFPNLEDRTTWLQGLREHGVVRNIDTQIRRKSGQIASVLFSIVQIDVNGEKMGLVMVTDITERRKAEESLRRAHDELEQRVLERTRELSDEIAERKEIERQLRIETAALEATANGVIITDASGTILWANPAFLTMSGYSMDEVIGATPNILSSDRQEKAYYQDLWRTIMGGNTWRGEMINRRKDGTLYVEEQTITPVRLEGGQLSYFIAIKQDVTERKRAEDALRESEEKFRTLVEWTYDWEIWLDPRGNVIYCSPSCERITGYEPEEFAAMPDLISRIVHPEDFPFYEEHLKTLHDEAAGMEKVEYRILARNGNEHWIEHVCRPLFGTDNHYLGRRISNRDITEQKQIEENIRERNRKEKILTQTIHTMQLDIARDLHDTIGQNIGYLRMKLDHMVEKDLYEKGADLKTEFNQMSQVANESYDLVRGTLAILQSQGPDDLLQLFKRYAGQIVERSGLKIEFASHGKAEFVTIQQMRQLFYIFREALSNIEKHSNAGHAWVNMRWSVNMVELSIRDDGSGFIPSQVPAGHYGLKFMQERTELLQGSYQLKTQPGAGTEIIIGVPLQRVGSEN